MTNPEQTLRERLAAKAHENMHNSSSYSLSPDDALSVFREWLESEAMTNDVATEIWQHLQASGLAYEAEERRATIAAKAAKFSLVQSLGDTP